MIQIGMGFCVFFFTGKIKFRSLGLGITNEKSERDLDLGKK